MAVAVFWTRLLLLGAIAAVAHGLTCHQCPLGVFNRCLFSSEVTCDNSTLNCYKGDAKFNATGVLQLHTRGCLDSDLCGRTVNGVILGAGLTSTFSCCQTDLCNGATSVPRLASVMAACCVAALAWPMWAS